MILTAEMSSLRTFRMYVGLLVRILNVTYSGDELSKKN